MNKIYVDAGGTWTTFSGFGKKVRVSSDLKNLKTQIITFQKSHHAKDLPIVIGIRGVWLPHEKLTWRRHLNGIAKEIKVTSDVELSYLLAFGTHPGILLNAGTGSIAIAKTQKGKIVRSGGLGPYLGDEGSAYWIGKKYLKNTRIKNWKKLRSLSVSQIASYGHVSLNKAVKGDKRNRSIIKESHDHLYQILKDVKIKSKLKSPLLHLTGGLFKNAYFRNQFKKRIRTGFRLSPG